ncbi:MAG: septum formation family protein [Actinomycetota bacterium]
MTSVEPLIGESRPGLAIGGGVLAGLLTLALISVVLIAIGGEDDGAAADERPQAGDPIDLAGLAAGDCIDPGSGAGGPVVLQDCATAHDAQVTARLPFPETDGDYPGADQLSLWVGRQCETAADAYLGAPLLSTVLEADSILPDFEDWAAGDTSVTCYVSRLDDLELTGSVDGRAAELARGTQVPVARLMVGDCFVPAGDVGSYELNSNSQVELVDCDASYNGVFFGRGALDAPVSGAAFPGDTEVGQLTSERCSILFREAFGQDADGFNYRYWRPNQQSWNLGDREILCAILDAEPLSGAFDPVEFLPFFELATGDCFHLGPEETSLSLGLDDQVRTVDCQVSHAGQMIGSGRLTTEDGAPYPGEEDVEQAAGAACEQLFEDFVGISPFESELVNFPFWYPNEAGWEQGDRRYACAFVDDVERIGSLEGAGV